MIIGTYATWELIEVSYIPEQNCKRYARNKATNEVCLVIDTAEDIYDPDVRIPQGLIDIHLNTLTQRK